MAGGAGRRRRRHVRPDQSEARSAVVEPRSAPTRRGVAVGTVGRRKILP